MQKDIRDRLGEKLQYWMNFALKCSWDKGFHCLHLQRSWTACTAKRDCSLITLLLYQHHLESTLLVAATAQSNHHASPLIGSHQKLPCHLIFSYYSIAQGDSITSSLFSGMRIARDETTKWKGRGKNQFTISPRSFKIKTMEEMCVLKCFSLLSGIWKEKEQVPQNLPSCPKALLNNFSSQNT